MRILCCVLGFCEPKQSSAGSPQLAGGSTAPQSAAAAATAPAATDAADLAAALGISRPLASKQRKLLQDYSPLKGKQLAQLLFRFEWSIRVLSTTNDGLWGMSGAWVMSLPDVLEQLCHVLSGPLLEPAFDAAPDSLEQQQLHSLLHSLLKLQRNDALGQRWSCDKAGLLPACMTAVSGILQGLRTQLQARQVTTTADLQLSSDHNSGGGTHDSSRSCGNSPNSLHTADRLSLSAGTSATATVTAEQEANVYSALVLLGRCCLVLSDMLQQESADVLETLATLLAARREGAMCSGHWKPNTAAFLCLQHQDSAGGTVLSFTLQNAFDVAEKMLGMDTYTGMPAHHVGLMCKRQLSNAHYASTSLEMIGRIAILQLELQISGSNQCSTAAAAAAAAPAAAGFASTLDILSKELQTAGLTLSALPTQVTCNSPSCTNLAGPSDILTVSGRSCVCGSCRVARYCCRACQRQHWKQHKPVCAALTGAAAVAAAAAAL
jgi:hypothetical protein